MAIGASPTLLEREAPLEILHEALRRTHRGDGRLVLVDGEAGVGKTALVRAFCAAARSGTRILEGGCDALATPRPLGPVLDVGAQVGGELARAVADGSATAVLAALLDELDRRPTVLVLEDLHWADEATLDLLKLLGRRVESTHGLVVGTLRDDELDSTHPLRLTLGGLASMPATHRLHLEPLSLSSVRVLSLLRSVDADELHRLTGGNPFYVTEVLAGDGGEVPATVRDAVLARAARLSEAARRLLDAIALVPGAAELWLLERVAPDELAELDACLASGMVIERAASVQFRHELARAVLEVEVEPLRRRDLHRAIRLALAEPPGGRVDHARLAHHGEAAGDVEAVLHHAVAAADDASASSAHREAAEQYARAVRFSSGLSDAELAALHDARMDACHLSEQVEQGLEAGAAALAGYRAAGDRLREGDVLRRIARLHYLAGRAGDARESAKAAVRLLEPLPHGRELAMAYGTVAQMAQIDLDVELAMSWAGMACTLGERLGDPESVSYALTTVGLCTAFSGDPTEVLQRSLALALEHGLEQYASRAYDALVFAAARRRDWAAVDRWLEHGLRHAAEHNLDGSTLYQLGWRAYASLARGRWDDAASDATTALAHPDARLTRAWALLALARVRARRGDPDPWTPLEEVRALTAQDTPQKLVPLSLVTTEAAFLAGDVERARHELSPLPAAELADRWIAGELAVWRRRLGLPAEDPGPVAEPFALELSGEHEAAADRWLDLESPYDAALTLSGSAREESLRRAHDLLRELGARPAAAIVARRLRERGATRVTRGPRRTTRENPAGLTARELEVVSLLGEGLRNADIAERLFVSRRTVDHHVSTILRKLGVSTRGEAVAVSAKLGLLEDR